MGCACSRPKALELLDPPQKGKATPTPPATPDAPAAAASPPEAATREKAVIPVRDLNQRTALANDPVSAHPAAAAAASGLAAGAVAAPSTDPCDFPVLVVPRMQPRGTRVLRSPSINEGYGAGGQNSMGSSVQHSRQNSADMAPSLEVATSAAIVDDLSGQRSPPPVRFEPWHDSDSSGFYGRRDSMSTDGGGSFSSARSFNSAWSGSEGATPSPHTSFRGSRLAPDRDSGAVVALKAPGGDRAHHHGTVSATAAARAAKRRLTHGISSVSAAAMHLGGGLKRRYYQDSHRQIVTAEQLEQQCVVEPEASKHAEQMLDSLQGAVLSTATADGYPMAAANGHSAPVDTESRMPVGAAPFPAASGVQAVSAISERSWQTLREALAHAAEGRILTASALLEPAAAASGLSEAAFLAKLESVVLPEASSDATNGDADPAAANEADASSLWAATYAEAGAAANAAAPPVAAPAEQLSARYSHHGVGDHSSQLSAEEVARVLALQAEAEWLQEGLRQFHDREGYVYARNDDLKVSYRHLKGSSVHSFRFEATYNCSVSHLLSISREFDLMASWNRFVLNPCVLHEPTPFSSLLYTGLWMPFPLPEMDFVVKITWSDVINEEGSMLVMVEDGTADTDHPDCEPLPERAARRTHLRMLPGSCAVFTPLTPGPGGEPRTLCEVLSHVEPHVQHTPAFVITFVLKVLSPFIYNATRKVLASPFFRDPDSAVNQRIGARRDVYGLIDRRFSEPSPAGLAKFERRSSQQGRSPQRRNSKDGHQHAS